MAEPRLASEGTKARRNDHVPAGDADAAVTAPRNGLVEIAGPERASLNEIVTRYPLVASSAQLTCTGAGVAEFAFRMSKQNNPPRPAARWRASGHPGSVRPMQKSGRVGEGNLRPRHPLRRRAVAPRNSLFEPSLAGIEEVALGHLAAYRSVDLTD